MMMMVMIACTPFFHDTTRRPAAAASAAGVLVPSLNAVTAVVGMTPPLPPMRNELQRRQHGPRN